MAVADKQSWRMDELLAELCRREGSDLLLTTGAPPKFRINGELMAFSLQPLDADATHRLAFSLLNEDRANELQSRLTCDFSVEVEGLSRFRIHIYHQRGALAIAVRLIALSIPSFEKLGVPRIAQEFAARPHGLMLVTGPTGSGKSTTLAAMVDQINATRNVHIVCIEDPIEYLHHHKRGIVDQREVERDTHSFADALRSVFRQSPDVIVVGEMRDFETISLALTLAESGHLILATLHTQDATHAIQRIIDTFPGDQQQQIATQLSLVLVGVLSQQLLPTVDGRHRVLVTEVMNVNSAIRNLIRERQLQQVYSVIQTGRPEGMVTMTDALGELCARGLITHETALARTPRPKEFTALMESRATGVTPGGR